MISFGEFFDHFAIKSRYVVRFAACDRTVVHDHFFIHPLRAGIFQIRLNGFIRSQFTAFHHAGINQRPGRDRSLPLVCPRQTSKMMLRELSSLRNCLICRQEKLTF